MEWKLIESEAQLDKVFQHSWENPVAIFKHSKRCAISSMALNRVERKWNFPPETIQPYFLDLWAFRSLSDEIAHRTGIRHESPQLLLLYKGEVLYNASHHVIDIDEVQAIIPS